MPRFQKPDGSITDELPAEQAPHYIAKGFIQLDDNGQPLNVATVDNPETIAELATAIAEIDELKVANSELLDKLSAADGAALQVDADHKKAIADLEAAHAKKIEDADKLRQHLQKQLTAAEAKIPKAGRQPA